jgi:uncharacterized protein (UPF0548 family)
MDDRRDRVDGPVDVADAPDRHPVDPLRAPRWPLGRIGPLLLPRLRRPSVPAIRDFIDRQSGLPLTYAEAGAVDDTPPPGYRANRARVRLGQGAADFAAGKSALRGWEQFPPGWVELCFPDVPIEPGQVVAVLARGLGVWWLNACRIVSVVDEDGPGACFGFAYGTLPGHVASGEERFLIEWDQADDSVWYDLSSFSRPNGWLAGLGHRYARGRQERFARESAEAMCRAVERRRD